MRLIVSSLLVAAALACATPSAATVVEITYRGHVVSGDDFTGVFGSVGSLAGASYTSTFLFDTAVGKLQLNDAFLPNAGSQRAEGGPDFDAAYPSPSLGSTFRIGKVTISLTGQDLGLVGSAHFEDGAGTIFSDTADHIDSVAAFIRKRNGNEVDGVHGLLPPLLTPFSYKVLPGDKAYGLFLTYRYDRSLNVETEWAAATLQPDTVTLRIPGQPSATPEPATWALMLAGLASVGAALRRRGGAGTATPPA